MLSCYYDNNYAINLGLHPHSGRSLRWHWSRYTGLHEKGDEHQQSPQFSHQSLGGFTQPRRRPQSEYERWWWWCHWYHYGYIAIVRLDHGGRYFRAFAGSGPFGIVLDDEYG